MKHLATVLGVTILAALSCSAPKGLDKDIEKVKELAVAQTRLLGASVGGDEMPRTFENGKLVTSDIRWWTSGFFPGVCWYTYQLTGDGDILQLAIEQTGKMQDPDRYFEHHDIGFQTMCSSGRAYKVTGDTTYLATIRRGAELLASRYNPVVRSVKSWDNPEYTFPVIIDNMMNLELLMYASKLFDNPEWAEMAIAHATTTLENHFREDYSSYHVVDYNPVDGSVLQKVTRQGFSDESSWSRGQAWGLYGFTMMYRESGKEEFLAQAENIARYLFPLLEKDPVPAWDFNADESSYSQKDASAAALMASAFIQLGRLTKDKTLSGKCRRQAEDIIRKLCTPEYLAAPGEQGGFLLKHSTGFYKAGSEVDVPLSYADYYFLEAIYNLEQGF